jgi:hypothetical protein
LRDLSSIFADRAIRMPRKLYFTVSNFRSPDAVHSSTCFFRAVLTPNLLNCIYTLDLPPVGCPFYHQPPECKDWKESHPAHIPITLSSFSDFQNAALQQEVTQTETSLTTKPADLVIPNFSNIAGYQTGPALNLISLDPVIIKSKNCPHLD